MAAITQAIRELIASGPYAHLTTLNRDGGPQVSVVWVGIENDEFVCGHMGAWQKVKNVNPGYITRITPERFAGIGPWSPGQR